MLTTNLPSIESAELIPEPPSSDSRKRRRFFTFLQKWRNWLRHQISPIQAADKDLTDRGVDDFLSLVFLVQFIRDRSANGIQSLNQLPRCQKVTTLGQLCTELQNTTSCPVLKTVFKPSRYAHTCALPASVMGRPFWEPVIQGSRPLYGPHLPITIFGDLHQWCLTFSPAETTGFEHGARSETRRYDKGIHYTPAGLVNYLTARVLGQGFESFGPDQFLKRRILDPSCGCGVFLVAALRYIFAWLKRSRKSPGVSDDLSLQERLNILNQMILGIDLDARAVELTIGGLLLTAWEGLGPNNVKIDETPVAVPDLSHNIVAGDFLASASFGSANGGIDVILGGPPFVRLQQMLHSNPATVTRYKRTFRTAQSGQFDLYLLFIEKAIDILVPNGWLAFSVSNTFLRSGTGSVLRQLIGEKCQVHEIVEFEDPKIYPDAVIQIALILFEKAMPTKGGRHVWIRGKGQLATKLAALSSASAHVSVETRLLGPETLRNDRWFFQSPEETDLLVKIQAIGKPLSHLAIHVGQGVVTGADDVFLLGSLQQERDGKILLEQRGTGRRLLIESGLLRPIIRNRDIRGYAQPTPATLCLVPYDASGKTMPERELQENFPLAYQYLLSCKDSLIARKQKQPGEWYAFASVAPFRFFGRMKIIGGLITSGGDMTIHSDPKLLCHSGVLLMTPNPLIIDPHYLLGVCNSDIFWTFVRHRMPTMGIGRHSLRLERVRQFPLVEPDQNQSLAQDIAAAVRRLVGDSCPAVEGAIVKADIDRMVRELYKI